MKTNTVLKIFLLSYILSGCFQTPTPRDTPSIEDGLVTISPSQIPSELRVTSAATKIDPISPTLTPSATRSNWLRVQCLGTENYQPPSGSVVEGILFVEDSNNLQYSFMNMSPENPISTTYQTHGALLEYGVSLDGRWLAFWELRDNPSGSADTSWIVIIDSTGQEYKAYMDNSFQGIIRWFDNERILVKYGASIDPWGLLVPSAILNPFTGELILLSNDFPDIYNLNRMYRWLDQTVTVYDASISRMVYPRVEGDIVLVNLETREIITRLTNVSLDSSVPVWSPDGEKFAIANVSVWENNYFPLIFDLYIVSREGLVTQMTNFSEYFSRTDIAAYSWSPDGRYIAFYLAGWQEESFMSTWAVLDIEAHEVTEYCVQPYYYSTIIARSPIWSPDGRQFVVEVDDPDDDDIKLFMVDIFEEYTYLIAENITAHGWMVSP